MVRTPWILALLLVACGSDAGSTSTSSNTSPPAATSSAAPIAAIPSSSASPSRADASATAPSSSAAPGTQADPSRLKLEGKPIQGGVVFAKVDGAVDRVEFLGHRAVVSDDGEFPIAFFRNAPKTEKMILHLHDGSILEHVFEVEQRTFATDKINGLPEEMVRLEPKEKKILEADEARIDALRLKYGKKACYHDGFKWPTIGKVTAHYGEMRVLNGTDGGIHWGVDIAVPSGTPVRAPACGTVVFAEQDIPLSGGTLIIDHGHGLFSTFIHLSAFDRKVGDEVKQGDMVAKSGSNGRTTGAHLDWRMNYFEIRVDPELLVEPMPSK